MASPAYEGRAGSSARRAAMQIFIAICFAAISLTAWGQTATRSGTVTDSSRAMVPPPPSNLAATAGNARVELTWRASAGATSYNLYVGTAAGEEGTTPIATGITATSYTDTNGLTNGTTYYYEVAAVNTGSAASPFSNEASATPLSTFPPTAVRASDFLNTVGVNTHMGYGWDDPREVAKLVTRIGIRNLRDDDNPSEVPDFIWVHQQTGAKFEVVWSGPDNTDLAYELNDSEQLANAGALLALEGPNEPNNFPLTWNGQTSSMTGPPYFWPVAEWQRALCSQAKRNPVLTNYPVFSVSEVGAEPNNVGLQFLIIPPGAGTLMPAGTQYAEYANNHNYLANNCGVIVPNQAWSAESPTEAGEAPSCVDGLFGEFGGPTWDGGFMGYSASQALTLPRVTTETGWPEASALTDDQIGRLYLNLYLDAVKEGWSYTFIYDLKDDGDGYGLANSDYSLRTQAIYLQNLTTILADASSDFTPGTLNYSVPNEPETVHDLLLQKSNGTFYIAVWDEELPGSGVSDSVTVDLGGTYNVAPYDTTRGPRSIQTLTSVSSVTLSLSDHPVILQLQRMLNEGR